MDGAFRPDATADTDAEDDPDRSSTPGVLAGLRERIADVVRRALTLVLGPAGTGDGPTWPDDAGGRDGDHDGTAPPWFDRTDPRATDDGSGTDATSPGAGDDSDRSGSTGPAPGSPGPTESPDPTTESTTPMTHTQRRGTCARCGLEFDAERGYTALDVFERAAENPRSESSERTIRLCDVCSEDFQDFVDLGRTDHSRSVPEFLRSR